jgi:small GTP-binding protein
MDVGLRISREYRHSSILLRDFAPFFDRLTVQGLTTKIQIWDTAGQEQFKKLAPMYYKNSAAAIICYDATSPKSLDEARYWVNELRTILQMDGIVLTICATKCDLAVPVDTQQAQQLAEEVGALFMQTSAKDNVHVTALFEMVTSRVLHLREAEGGPFSPVTLGSTSGEVNDKRILSPERIPRSPMGSTDDPRENSMVMDEKKIDDDDLVDKIDSHDTMDSKCDPTKYMCGDPGEFMGGATQQNCVIQ